MNIKADRFLPGEIAQLRKYEIFERKAYDKDTGHFVTQIPISWNEDPTASRGQYHYEDEIIYKLDRSYDLYAVWPEVNTYVYYNLFNSTIKREVTANKGYVLEDMSASIIGFKGWLNQNMEFLSAGSTIVPKTNVQLFLSTCQEISVSYDLNGGHLASGAADTQTALYSKWMTNEYKIKDIDATIVVHADSPTLDVPDAQFGYWVIDGVPYYKNDRVNFKDNMVARAQWLWTPDYSFSESIECIGEHDPAFGQLSVGISSETQTAFRQKYKAIPEDGYRFDYFSDRLFDGRAWRPEEKYSTSNVHEVSISKYNPVIDDLTEKLNVYVHTIAYFSRDFDNWFRIFLNDRTVQLVRRPTNIHEVVTDALLNTAGNEDVVKVQFPYDDVEHVESGIFAECTNLVEVELASRLKEIPAYMCKGDVNLTSIAYHALPENLRMVGDSAFEGCLKLNQIEQQLVDCIQTFGTRAFSGTAFIAFKFGEKTTSIGNEIFANARQLVALEIQSYTLGIFSQNSLNGSSVKKIRLTNISSTSIL